MLIFYRKTERRGEGITMNCCLNVIKLYLPGAKRRRVMNVPRL